MNENKNHFMPHELQATATTKETAKKWVIGGGLFNCIVAFPFAMPFLSDFYILLFNNVNFFFGFGGTRWLPPSEGANMLFLNTAGLALFLVGMTLLYASKKIIERAEISLFNGIIRFVWGVIATYYIVKYEIINIMFLIVIIDFVLASAYIYYYFQIQKLRQSKNMHEQN